MPTAVTSGKRRSPGLEARIFAGASIRAAPRPDALRGGAAAEMAADVRMRQRELTELILRERELRGSRERGPHITAVPYENMVHRATKRRSPSGQTVNDSTNTMASTQLLAAQHAAKTAWSATGSAPRPRAGAAPEVHVIPPTPESGTKIVRLGCGSPPPPRAASAQGRTLRRTNTPAQRRGRGGEGWSSAKGVGAYFAPAPVDSDGAERGLRRRGGVAGCRYARDLAGAGVSEAVGVATQKRSSSAPVKPARRARTEIDDNAAGRMPPGHMYSKRIFHEHHQPGELFGASQPAQPRGEAKRGECSASLLDVGAHSERQGRLRCKGQRAASCSARRVNHIGHAAPPSPRVAAPRSFNPILGF